MKPASMTCASFVLALFFGQRSLQVLHSTSFFREGRENSGTTFPRRELRF
jgi:hypothetical protein